MSTLAHEVLPVMIENELKQAYLDYAMSVIVGRALPDVRDGLKPVHRRALFAMHELGNEWNKPYKKSARVVGDVIGKYHPHGDQSVYDTIVRMAQSFTMRYMLVDGQGNFGSVDGDSAAAMRYTEVRMAKITHAILADLEKETVDFSPNYDGSEMVPTVFPTRIPNLLINGSAGIAVGMATTIPPHNLTEVINACLALIQDSNLTVDDLMRYIPGPDFPTKAIINGRSGIIDAYRTGRGRIYVRARVTIEEDEHHKSTILVHELPYQVNKARLIEKIAELVKDKKVEGITALRDESDKDGMRIVIELRRGENAEVLINNLYNQTQLQCVIGINMVALVDGQPRTLSLKQILQEFIKHRRVVVNRRTVFDLKRARERAHILEGLGISLANLDPVIQLIKSSPNPLEAKIRLQATPWQLGSVQGMLDQAGAQISRPEGLSPALGLVKGQYYLSEVQAQAILDLRLHRLTGLEQDKILEEYKEVLLRIQALNEILENPERLMAVVSEELLQIKEEFGDNRYTEILGDHLDLTREDLIPREEMVVTLSQQGYVKAQPLSSYQAQHRGGRGKTATQVKDEDFVTHLIIGCTHDTILCFSNRGKVYWLKVYHLPVGSRTSKGRPIINLLPLEKEEQISAILPLTAYNENQYVFMASSQGIVKKVALQEFSRPRNAGIIAVDLVENDVLVGAQITDGQSSVMLFTNTGKVIRFHEDAVRAMGRAARGVIGIRLADPSQRVISLIVVDPNCAVLTATQNGYGKRTLMHEFPTKGRGGQGVISIQTSDRNGLVVGAIPVAANDEVMLITNKGTLVRIRVEEISVVGRNTQGVRLIQLSNGELLVNLQRIQEVQGPDLPEQAIETVQDINDLEEPSEE